MEREHDLLKALIDYLIKHGYPKDSFVLEWKVGNRIIDLAVIERITNKPVALFELKRRKNQETINIAINQLRAFTMELGNEQIPIYVVFPSIGKLPFEIYNIKDLQENQIEEIERVPDFDFLENTFKKKEIIKVKKKEKDTIDIFATICWMASVLVAVLFVLNLLNERIQITYIDLSLIGVVIALAILPFSSKLKFLGIEFNRLKDKKK